MARIRYIKPGFFTDEDLANLPLETRLTYAGLWCYADKAGRLEDRPRFLKAMIFPYDDVDMERQLDLLAQPKKNGKPFINRYLTDNQEIIQILNWDEHQRPHHTEAISKLPELSKSSIKKDCSNKQRLDNGELTVREREGMEKGMGKGKGEKEEKKAAPEPVDNSDQEYEDDRPSAALSQEQKERLALLCTNLQSKRRDFNPFAFIGHCIKQNAHPGAIIRALERLLQYCPTVPKPWPYCCQIAEVETGNFSEQEFIKNQDLVDWGSIVDDLKKVQEGKA